MTNKLITDSEIRQAVIAQGYADCSVVRQVKPLRQGTDLESGTWYCLFVVYRDGMTPECWGRRRTLVELLAMAERGPLFRQRTATTRFNAR